ncbi:reverse transcriptase family protein [Aliiglaciecola sp. NS0011-25]|uniref:reverse transcriptase family protein n=1 Tax=Aliiglaciecola sp. NS0011-25 TaxID=3127654 RepID=UPI00310B403F
MKRIDKDSFFKILGIEPKIISKFPTVQTYQFKIGQKFVYAVKHDSKIQSYQEALNSKFLNLVPLNNAAKAFRKGGSYFEFLEPHRHNYNFLRLDLKNFFHSINEDTLKTVFSNYIEDEIVEVGSLKQKLLDIFVNLVSLQLPKNSDNKSFAGTFIVPMGFRTSPAISNIVFRKLDIIIQKHCAPKGIEYTRYADDMLFSSEFNDKYLESQRFIEVISEIISIDGFKLNRKKTIFKKHLLSINGHVIEGARSDFKSGDVRLSASKLKLLEKLFYEIKNNTSNDNILKKVFGIDVRNVQFPLPKTQKAFMDKYCQDQLVNKVAGYRSYLISFLKFLERSGIKNTASEAKYRQMLANLDGALSKIQRS